MLPALRFERLGALRGEERHGGLAGAQLCDAADSGDGDAGDRAGQANLRGGGEQKFVVFSAVEGLGQGCGAVDGKLSGVDLGGYARLPAEMGQIGGEAVAQVNGGRSGAVADKPESLADAGLGIEVLGQRGFQLAGDSERAGAGRPGFGQPGEAGERGRGSAKGARDIEQMARAGGGSFEPRSDNNRARVRFPPAESPSTINRSASTPSPSNHS